MIRAADWRFILKNMFIINDLQNASVADIQFTACVQEPFRPTIKFATITVVLTLGLTEADRC